MVRLRALLPLTDCDLSLCPQLCALFHLHALGRSLRAPEHETQRCPWDHLWDPGCPLAAGVRSVCGPALLVLQDPVLLPTGLRKLRPYPKGVTVV